MKLRYATIFALIALVLSACSFTLAEDITPPPGYVPPTAAPTLGPLFPAQAPDVQNGAAIYADKCSPCHGTTGLGDGEKGKQLPVTVAAFALPETARKSSPAQWFTTVTQGNLDRFMPPFVSLDDQQRWDVIAYAFTLHTTPEEIANGKALYEANCAACHADGFKQEYMAGKSEDALVFFILKGHDKFPASKLSKDESYSVASYMRTLTFALPIPTATVVPVTETPVAAENGTPSAVVTPLEGTAQPQATSEAAATPAAGFGNVLGSIDNKTGASLPSDLTVTLRAYEHGGDPNAGPKEIFNLQAPVSTDGTYKFENIELSANRIFVSEVIYQGMTLKSDFVIVKAGDTELNIPTITLYSTTTDTTLLGVQDVSLFFDFASETDAQVVALYTITNASEKTVLVKAGADLNIPFIKFPEGWKALGFQDTQKSATFASTADGFAMPPSTTPYELLAFASRPKETKMEFKQTFVLPVTSVRIILPEGMTAAGDQLKDAGMQLIQNANFQTYTGAHFDAGSTLTFTISGKPSGVAIKTSSLDSKQMILIGAGALGLVLIIVGIWMFLRDRRRDDDEEDQDEFASQEDVMDAIIALDDLHRAGKISDEAYQKRRDELKNALKEIS